jgi:predicted permease
MGRWLFVVRLRLRSIFRRRQVEGELDEELRIHLEQRVASEIARGKSPADARRTAIQNMQGLEQTKEECRDMRRLNLIDNLVRDLRYALRTLARNPGFTLVALLALTLGIGVNTAVFSVVNGVLLRPLPYADPDRLVMIFDSFQQQGMEHGPGGIADFLDWKAQAHSFQSLDAVANNRFTLTGDGEAEQILGAGATSTFFETLGVRPALGRGFAPGGDQPGRPSTVVLSDRLWRRRYGANPAILGQQILLNGRPYAVIGVMPASFRFGSREADVWAALTLNPPNRRGPFFLRGVARLKPGVTAEQAAAEMSTIGQAVERANPRDYGRLRFPVISLRETIVGDVRPLLWVLSGAVLLVLLIAVSNVANLMLARATARQREIAVRLSIGAGRGRLIGQFMTESLLLSLAGGVCGAALAYAGMAALRWLGARYLPRLDEIEIDGRVLAFTLMCSLGSAVIFGLAPSLAASAGKLGDALKEGGRGGESRGRGRARALLVVAQVTLSLLLLVGAGLFLRSFDLLGRVSPGFQVPPDRLLTMLVSPTGPRYREAAALRNYWNQLLDRVRAIPGVDSAAVSVSIPPNRSAYTDGYEIEGKSLPAGVENVAVTIPVVSYDYFKAFGIPLLQGRWFDQRDTADGPRVTIISESMARKHFAGENPVGRRLKHGGRASANPYMEIVGVVGDAKYQGLEWENEPVYYELSVQSPSRPMWLVARTTGDARPAAAVRAAVRELDPGVPVDRVGVMTETLAESVSLPRFRSFTMGVFAGAALLLAAIGIYGVIAYSVVQRTQEIGVRMALGATRSGVLWMVVRQASRLSVAGIAMGLVGAFGLTRLVRNMLFGIGPSDTVTFAGAAMVLGAVAIVASLVPALRAARIDPITALRHE